MSIDESHPVAVATGDASDEVLDVAEGSSDCGAGLAGAKPGLDLELALAGGLVGHEMEVQVEMLEVAAELASGSLHFDDFGVNFDFNAIRDVHSL